MQILLKDFVKIVNFLGKKTPGGEPGVFIFKGFFSLIYGLSGLKCGFVFYFSAMPITMYR
jgi:hypothetical protein